MKPEIKDIQEVFFEAMAAGYAQSVPKIRIMEIHGSKAIPFVRGDFEVLDLWLVTPYSNMSDGTTYIWHNGIPVWTMHYGGYYEEAAIPFLKKCLRRAYVEERRFYGGRGPAFVHDESFAYFNRIDSGDFAEFKGMEAIFDIHGERLGYHWYRGGSLLENHR